MIPLSRRFLLFVLSGAIFVLFCMALAACKPSSEPAPIETQPVETATTAPTATFTPLPSPTALPERVILLAPAGSDPTLAGEMQNLLGGLASQEGYILEVKAGLSEMDFGEDLRLVVALPPDTGIANFAAAYPSVQFFAIGIPGVQAGGNLSVIGAGGDRPDQQGFMAGYIAALVTPDWRVGVISAGDTGPGRAARQGFLNGAIFFCGLCRPAYPPFVQYPDYYEVPSTASQTDKQAAADYLIGQGVKTVYVYPALADEALLLYLAQAGVNLIGSGAPPASVQNNWIASIGVDWVSAVQEAWSNWSDGEAFGGGSSALTLSNQNPNLFSPGRQNLAEKILADLTAGYIDSGVDPITGEPR